VREVKFDGKLKMLNKVLSVRFQASRTEQYTQACDKSAVVNSFLVKARSNVPLRVVAGHASRFTSTHALDDRTVTQKLLY